MTAQNPGTQRAHDSHDRLLVARFALGDELAPDEAASVRATLAGCTDCRELVGEMQVVQQETAASLAPARPRDFFITTEQAATLRPNAWLRFLGRFSAPRMTVLRPFAGATLAIGVVLVGVSAVLPPRDLAAPAPETNSMMVVASPLTGDAADNSIAGQEPDAQATRDPNGREADPATKASPAAFATTMEMQPMGSGPLRVMAGTSPAPQPTVVTGVIVEAPPEVADGRASADSVATAPGRSDDILGSALLVVGLLLAAVSALVLALAWLARRDTDPLLR